MAASFDHLTLSAYVDGELDRKTMHEVEDFLDRDRDARQFVLDTMRTTVLLRAGSTDALHEPVPDRLQAAVTGATTSNTVLAGSVVSVRQTGGRIRPGGHRRRPRFFP